MANRLPTVSGDSGNWGTILNNYLSVEHNSDGTLSNVARPKDLVFNVKTSYGAKGDGVTDDTTAVQNAITDAVSSGGTVFFPVGVYLCGALTITGTIAMIGAGGWGVADANGSRIKAKSSINTHLVQFSPPANTGIVGAEIRNLIFDGQGSHQTAGDVFYALGAIQCLWDHCHFTNPYRAGLHLYQDGSSGTGHHNRIVNCLFDGGNASAGEGTGLKIEASDENYVVNCDFENNGTNQSNSAQIYDQSGLNCISNCVFVNGYRGIKIQGDVSKVIGCYFDGTTLEPIRLNGKKNIIIGNTLSNIGAHQNADGIIPDNVPETLIIGNVFTPGGNAQSAINLTVGPPTNTMIMDNDFNTTDGTWAASVVNIGTGTGHRIRNNRGWNPVGAQTAPSIPTSGSAFTNPFAYDCTVFITGGTVTAIAIGGTATGLTSGAFRVPAGQTITLTYSAAPSWTWFGD